MSHLGDFDAAAIIYGKFTSYQASTGAPFTLAGTPALSVYKDASTTQSTTGVTLTVSFDSVTGMNHYAIDTSADGTFYAAGSFFSIVITTGTVDGISVVGAVVASFTIRKSSSLKPATAGRTLAVDASSFAPVSSGTGSGQVDLTSGQVRVQSGTGSGQISASSGAVKIQGTVKKNTAINNYPFVMRDLSGLPRTGLTVTATRKIDSGSFSACANAPAEIADGWYEIDLAAADLNGVTIALSLTATGSSGTFATIVTVP
jgi:hypothetical protein